MANQPTITNSDTSDIAVFDNEYSPRTVTVAAGEVLARGTVLAEDTTNDTVIICESDSATGADAPRFILMQELDNSAGQAAAEFTVQVMVKGGFDADNIVFDNGADTLDTVGATTARRMRNVLNDQGLIAVERADLSVLDNQ